VAETSGRVKPGRAYYALTALSLSIGWGIRGNFGHEYGALLPGALAAMAVVLLSGRDDWHRRVAYFAMFGALGWSFGGSMSYMQVVAYTHSGHSLSVLYGFACLFVIGFLWAAPGGAGTALAAFADRGLLTELFAPITAVFVAWWLQGVLIAPKLASLFGREWLNWYDSDWLAALLAAVAALVLAASRGRLDRATSLVLHMALGWWAGFVLLVLVIGLRMTPPRGDNWAGCAGMTAGILVYCLRNGLSPVARAALVTGFVGGIGFAAASMLKLVEITCGLDTNWHSILEQTTGLFNGLAVALALAGPARTAASPSDAAVEDDGTGTLAPAPARGWTQVYAVGFVLLGITYLNLRKNPELWVRDRVMPEMLAGLPTVTWFDLSYLALAAAVLIPLARHLRRPLALVPESPLGRGQWLYLVLLWWMVAGNFDRAIVNFTPQRLVTEGVIHLNAVLSTLVLILAPGVAWSAPPDGAGQTRGKESRIGRLVAVGLVAGALSVFFDWGIVRAIYGDRYAGGKYSGLSIRFGPNATTAPKPKPLR
jgi:hypothetical protein